MTPSLVIEHEILEALRQIMRAVDLHSRSLLQAYGLTAPQLAALREIDRRQGITPARLARGIHLSEPTVNGILNRLEQRGLVQRGREGGDRRSVVVRVTPEGARMLASAPPPLQERFREALQRLPAWEQSHMLATLQRVASMMGAEALPAGVEPPAASDQGDLVRGEREPSPAAESRQAGVTSPAGS